MDAKIRQLAELGFYAYGSAIHVKEPHGDLDATIDLAVDKIERRVKKQK